MVDRIVGSESSAPATSVESVDGASVLPARASAAVTGLGGLDVFVGEIQAKLDEIESASRSARRAERELRRDEERAVVGKMHEAADWALAAGIAGGAAKVGGAVASGAGAAASAGSASSSGSGGGGAAGASASAPDRTGADWGRSLSSGLDGAGDVLGGVFGSLRGHADAGAEAGRSRARAAGDAVDDADASIAATSRAREKQLDALERCLEESRRSSEASLRG